MLKTSDDNFLKRNYPLVLIAVGFFLVLFPFNLVGADQLGSTSLSLYGLVAVLIVGFVTHYKKRNDYSAKTRKIVKIAALAMPLLLVAAVIFGVVLMAPPIPSRYSWSQPNIWIWICLKKRLLIG